MSQWNRRSFLQLGAAATVASATCAASDGHEPDSGQHDNSVGVLVDTTLCIGCRKCEEACNRRNRLPRTAASFADRTVLHSFRRPGAEAFTVVNQFRGSPSPDQADVPNTYSKVQCMHCLNPSCVSACIVGALTRADDGAVVYDPTICIGCRYCMVACPFEIPAYQYDTPLAPKVRKCEFCFGTTDSGGADPACAAACPTEALVFGRRADLLAIAHDRLEKRPDRYQPHVYGEREVGGTGWLYLTGRPVDEVGLLPLPDEAPALRTEAIQHGIFKYGLLPVGFYGLLGGIMWFNHRRATNGGDRTGDPQGSPAVSTGAEVHNDSE
jgi:formate dehydrogenase iron-sulfur subunit